MGTGTKSEIIEAITNQMYSESIIQSERIREVKDILTVALYNYSLLPITETAVVEPATERTRRLIEYYISKKTVAGCTKRSIEQVILVVRQLLETVRKPVDEIDTDDVYMFLAVWKQRSGCCNVTMDNKRLMLRSFFECLRKNKKIKENPMDSVDRIKCRIKLKTPLTEMETAALEASCKTAREKAILYFFLETGVRCGELCGINISDVDFRTYKCRVLGKGNKERNVYFTGKTAFFLEEYMRSRKDIPSNLPVVHADIPLFTSKVRPYGRITNSGIGKILKRLGEESGITRVHPHLLRATYATTLAKRGVPIDRIAKALGHAGLSTINRYVLLSDDVLETEIRRAGTAA